MNKRWDECGLVQLWETLYLLPKPGKDVATFVEAGALKCAEGASY